MRSPPGGGPTVQGCATRLGGHGAVMMSQKDIEAAFDGLDLDKNLYVGAAELRHVLACMGELATDAEVDAMIRLVDADGDGQVSFFEFAAIMRHADPSSPSFSAHLSRQVQEEASGPASDVNLAPPPIVLPESGSAGGGAQRQLHIGSHPAARRAALGRVDEMTRRGQKRDACAAFVKATGIGLPELRQWAAAAMRLSSSSSAVAADNNDEDDGRHSSGTGLDQAAVPELVHVLVNDPSTRMGISMLSIQQLLTPFQQPQSNNNGSGTARPPKSSVFGLPSRPADPPPPLPPPPQTTVGNRTSRATIGSTTTTAAGGADGGGAVTLRELILSLSAFVGASLEQRLLLCFDLLDADGSGSLSRRELGVVLSSQHLLADAEWIKRKTDTIMAMVDADGSGQIELGEFRALARQFGNLLLPDQGGGGRE